MKTRFTIIAIALMTVLACEKSTDNFNPVEQKMLYIEESELNDVALMLTEIGLDNDLCNEVHTSVSIAIEKGLDEDLYFRELWMKDEDIKVKSYNSGSILKERLEDYFMKIPSTKNTEGNFLKDSNIEIYWPYSKNWDGKTKPVIAPVPVGQECDTLYGYKVVSEPGTKVKLDTVLVNDDYAYENPVWIINYMEFPYDDTTMENIQIETPTKAVTLNVWEFNSMTVEKQYDKLSNGGSEFHVVSVSPTDVYHVNTRYVEFERDEIRNKKTKIFDEDRLLNSDWTEDEVSNYFGIVECDAGTPMKNVSTTTEYVDSNTGTTASATINYSIDNKDTELFGISYKRTYIMSPLCAGTKSIQDGKIKWTMSMNEYNY